jgi:hypothetical protein
MPWRALFASGNGDLDRGATSDQPQRGGRAVAQDGSGPAREHGGHPTTVLSEQPVTDRVDAAVDGAEQPALQPIVDRAASKAKL